MTDWVWLGKLPPRRRIIVDLLDNYQDVVNGLRDTGAGQGEGVIGMCRAWNHPSYRELERLRVALRDNLPRVYWHVAERWLRAETRRAYLCPRCGLEGKEDIHRHGRSSVHRVWRSVPRVSAAVSPDVCRAGVEWLDMRWKGEPFLPDELLHLAA